MQSNRFADTRDFLSQTKFYEGYSRFKEDYGNYESWDEAVDRVISMHEKNYSENMDNLGNYIEEARTAYKEQRVLGAQRALQFGGEQLMKHQMRMYNCTSSYADRAEFFGEFFYILLCGAGAIFFLRNMLTQHKDAIDGKRVLISGSGNVATHAAEKCIQLGATPLTLSDSGGFIHCPDGLTQEQVDWIKDLKGVRRGRISEAADEFANITFHEGRPWGVEADCAVPSATQNEVNAEEAATMIKNGIMAVAEAANMPCEQGAVDTFMDANVMFGPAKAVNAGGVGVSGLEMSQNSARIAWDEDELRRLLENMMRDIHDSCVQYGESSDGPVNYLKGSNIAGFVKVADAMMSYGHV